MSDPKRRRWQSAALLAVLLALTLAMRAGVLVAMQDNLRQDPDAYRNIADNLVWFRVYGMGTSRDQPPQPTAYRPPLYPLVLAKFASDDTGVVLWRVAVVHVVLGLATVWLTWVVAGQMEGSGFRVQGSAAEEGERGRGGKGERGRESSPVFRFTAGLLVACDPLLLNQSTLVMTETLAAFLTVLCLFCLNRFAADRRPWSAGLAGGAIALAILCRPTYLPWLAIVGLTMLLLRSTNPKRERGTERSAGGDSPSLTLRVSMRGWLWRGVNVATLMLIAAIVLSPWAIRNYRVFGKPIVSTTHGGYTLLLANNPHFFRYLSDDKTGLPWDIDTSPPSRIEFSATTRPSSFKEEAEMEREAAFIYEFSPAAKRYPAELWLDDRQYQFAWEVIKSQPSQFVSACLYRLRQLWSPLPHRLTADESTAKMAMRYAVAAWYIAVYLLAAVGIWKLRSKLLAPPWLWGVLLCLVFTGIHAFYWTNLRMRAPLMPFVALVAAYGISELIRRVVLARSASAGPPK
jgi:hypothetical protein